jgi:hypothetical protein
MSGRCLDYQMVMLPLPRLAVNQKAEVGRPINLVVEVNEIASSRY